MPIPTMEQVLDSLEHAPARGAQKVDLEVRVANLHAAVAKANAEAMHAASERLAQVIGASIEAQERTRQTTIDATNVLKDSADALTAASNDNTLQMSRCAKSTAEQTQAIARWTKWLTIATIALFVSAVIQAVIAWISLFKIMKTDALRPDPPRETQPVVVR